MQIPTVDISVVLQLAVVFGWATVLLLVDLFVPPDQKRITGYLALAGLVVAAVAGIPTWGLVRTSFADMITIDTYALTLNYLYLAVAAITILLSINYLPRHGIEKGEYYILILLAVGGMMLLSQGVDLIVIFLGLELLSITLYVLTGFAYPRLSSEEAAMKYLLIGAFAAGFLVFGIALVYGATGTSNLARINTALAPGNLLAEDNLLMLGGAALLTVGLSYKIAMAPFHMWTPDVYEGSPTPVAAFMSVGTKAAGFAALTRVLVEGFQPISSIWVPAIAVLAGVTMLVGNITAVAQTNVKRMLAYSSIGHAGYILMGTLAAGFAASINRGIESMLFYLVAYAFTNLATFAVLMTLEQRGEEAWNLNDFAGLYQRNPWLATAMLICLSSLAGVPPTAGFVAKFFVFSAAWQAGLYTLALVAVVTSAVAAFYYLRIVVLMFMNAPTREVEPVVDRSLGVGLGIATALTLLLGILPAPIINVVQQAVLAVGR